MKYRLEGIIGEGAYAVTHKAKDENGNTVVVKQFKKAVYVEDHIWKREFTLLRSIQHRQIPKYIDHYTEKVHGKTVPHIVMEFCEGEPLEKRIENRRDTTEDILGYTQQILSILTYLQSLSPPIMHRDIKPQNILITDDEFVYLIDFGLAKDDIDRTLGDSIGVGTLCYQAPEQIAGNADIRSDLYSVGVLVVYWLTRVKPYKMLEGMRLRWRKKCLHLDVDVQNWLEKMLSEDPNLRFSSAKEALEHIPVVRTDVPVMTAALRTPQGKPPDDFLHRLQQEQEKRSKELAEQRKEELDRKRKEEMKRQKEEQEAIITRRENRKKQERKQKAMVLLEQKKSDVIVEMESAWEHGISALSAQMVDVEGFIDSFLDSFVPRSRLRHETYSLNVEHPFLSFAKAYRRQEYKETLGRSGLEYFVFLTEKWEKRESSEKFLMLYWGVFFPKYTTVSSVKNFFEQSWERLLHNSWKEQMESELDSAHEDLVVRTDWQFSMLSRTSIAIFTAFALFFLVLCFRYSSHPVISFVISGVVYLIGFIFTLQFGLFLSANIKSLVGNHTSGQSVNMLDLLGATATGFSQVFQGVWRVIASLIFSPLAMCLLFPMCSDFYFDVSFEKKGFADRIDDLESFPNWKMQEMVWEYYPDIYTFNLIFFLLAISGPSLFALVVTMINRRKEEEKNITTKRIKETYKKKVWENFR